MCSTNLQEVAFYNPSLTQMKFSHIFNQQVQFVFTIFEFQTTSTVSAIIITYEALIKCNAYSFFMLI